jgi:hypothetical protein
MAEEEVVFVHPDGRRVAGRIAIGAPFNAGRECAIEVSLQGIEPRLSTKIYGETTLQALMLGIRFMGYRLHDFLEKGGRIVYGDDQAFPIDAYFAGLLTDPPRAPD